MTIPKRFSRRDFLKIGASATFGVAMSACGRVLSPPATNTPFPTSTDTPFPTTAPIPTPSPTPYCTDPMSVIPTPPIKGQRYTAVVPDTLDIQQRAELVLGTMINCTDPQSNYAPYDNMFLWNNPPVMRGITTNNGKYIEATALLRYMTGSLTFQYIDQTWRRVFLGTHFASYPWWGVDPGRMLAWLGNNYRIEKDPCWRELGKQAVSRCAQSMVYEDDYCYYPTEQGTMPTGWDATWGGWVLQGLSQLFSATGDSGTLDLAGKLARYLKDHAQVFDAEAHFLARHPSDNGPALHFHHNGNVLEGISAYALATNDHEFASFARSGYEWARSLGSPLVGFFPEYIYDWPDDRPYIDCETCCTADMIQIALNLSEAQEGDYWDDVDRYVRNQFSEMQLLDSTWIDQMVATLPHRTPEANEDGYRVSERVVGAFASWASANDWYIEGTGGTTFCCIGNGGRTLYYVWEKMIRFMNGTLSIHLLLNRASPWADINSYVPYEGRVDISMKTSCDLEVRIPEWASPKDVSGFVNGTPRTLEFRGRYAQIGYVDPGNLVTLTFPISERTVDTVIGNVPYTLVIKGNDVVSINPSGVWYPFYQRTRFRENQVRWANRERFVPEI